MRKQKAQISCAVTAQLISVFVFAIQVVQFLVFLNQKFQASNHLLRLYRLICVRPGRKPQRRVFLHCSSIVLMNSERGQNPGKTGRHRDKPCYHQGSTVTNWDDPAQTVGDWDKIRLFKHKPALHRDSTGVNRGEPGCHQDKLALKIWPRCPVCPSSPR